MCRFLLYTLFIFAIVQIQLRWKHDKEVEPKWAYTFNGAVNNCTAATCMFSFDDRTLASLHLQDNIFTVKKATPVEIHGIINIVEVPPKGLQVYRFDIVSNGIVLRTIQTLSPTSVDFIHRMHFKVAHNLQFVSSNASNSSIQMELGFTRLNSI